MTARTPIEVQMTHLQAQSASGLGLKDYCEREGLTLKTFTNWRTRANREKDMKRVPAVPLGPTLHEQALMAEIASLQAALHNAEIKIKSLSNVVIILGHQVGEE